VTGPETDPPVARDAPLRFPLLMEEFTRSVVLPEQLDSLLNLGWRHFGRHFFRYSLFLGENRMHWVQPVRVDLRRVVPSTSQRRILRRNEDLAVNVGKPVNDAEHRDLFLRHRARFSENMPDNLANFLGADLDQYPCPMVEVAARLDGVLVAASYLDLGVTCATSVYAIFEPVLARRSLGIATMLWEIRHAQSHGCFHYHPGYAFHEPSEMDYKKHFTGSEWFDWRENWLPLPRQSRAPSPR
jgi:arginine-tRNA-protein transferase